MGERIVIMVSQTILICYWFKNFPGKTFHWSRSAHAY